MPLPKGYVLDEPSLPAGYTLDPPATWAESQAARKQQLIAQGGLPAENANFEPATPMEHVASFATHTAPAAVAASLGRFTIPADLAISFARNLQMTPEELAAKFEAGLGSGSPTQMVGQFAQTPVTSAVSGAADSTGDALAQLVGVRPNAITDVSSALGNIAGTVVAPHAEAGVKQTATAMTEPIRRALSENTAPKIMRNLIKPSNTQLKFGADPGEFTAGMKTSGNDLSSLEPQIESKIQSLETKATKIAYQTPRGRTVPIDYETPIKESFDKAIQSALLDGNESAATRLARVRDNEIALLKRQTGGDGTAPAWAGRRYHQGLGDRVRKFSEDPADATIRTARQDAWESIKQRTNEAVPELEAINNQIHSGIEAKKAAVNAALNQSKADPLSMRHAIVNTATGPYVRSRVASGLRGLYGAKPVAESPFLPPVGVGGAVGPNSAFTPRPGDDIINWFQRTATPHGGGAPSRAPEGYIVEHAGGAPMDLSQGLFEPAQFRHQQPPPLRAPFLRQDTPQTIAPSQPLASGDLGGAIPPHAMEDVVALWKAGRISGEDFQAWLNSPAQQANMAMLGYTKVPQPAPVTVPPQPNAHAEDWLMQLLNNYSQRR